MCDIETAKSNGAIGVYTLIDEAEFSVRLAVARSMQSDAQLRALVKRAAGYMMGSRHREAAFWILLSNKLGEDPVDRNYLTSLKRLRRAEKRSPVITGG